MNPMMDTADDLGAARRNHSASRWVEACERYAVADRVAPLSVEDRERWAEAAQVGGRISEAVEQLGRCFEEHSSAGAIHEATRAAYWLWSAHAFARAEFALGAGWVERAREAAGGEEYGWLLIPQAYRHLARGDWQTAEATLRRASELGLSCGDVDLVTIATTMRGRATLKLGFLERGVALLDEAIVRIVTGSTSVRTTCAMYCAAIGSCYEAREIGRAAEWSAALDAWLTTNPSVTGVYYGNCRIYRAMLLRLRGEWARSETELEQTCADLAVDAQLIVGHAWYELGEIRRLQGKADAGEAYERAVAYGHSGQPGLAQLRWREGNLDAAESGLRRALAEETQPDERLTLLPAAAELAIAHGDLDAADDLVAEIESSLSTYPTLALRATADSVRGCVLLAQGLGSDALPRLRASSDAWRELGAPYEVAVVGRSLAQARRAVGDEEGAVLEVRASLATFESLGARPDAHLTREMLGENTRLLSPRETEVLRLIIDGHTNAEIAVRLHLSERTVHRHVSNILTKLGVSSRTAAAIDAVKRGLV